MQTDSIFFQLFSVYPGSFFELIGLPSEAAQSYRFDSVEVKQTSFRIDGVFLPLAENPLSPIIFAEVQFQKDPALYKRLFSEIFLYLRWADGNPDWRAVVVFAKRSIEPDVTTGYDWMLNDPNVQRIYLDELADGECSLGIDIIRLVVESEETAKLQARLLVERARRVADAALGREIVELIETILLYKFPRLSREEIEAMFSVSDLKKTKVYQEALQAGREEGRLEVAREMLANGMPIEVVQKMTKLPLEELQKIAATDR